MGERTMKGVEEKGGKELGEVRKEEVRGRGVQSEREREKKKKEVGEMRLKTRVRRKVTQTSKEMKEERRNGVKE